jgi:hypothetical protein
MKKHGFTPQQALDYIAARRGQISKHLHQRPAVMEYWKRLEKARLQQQQHALPATK